MLRSDRGSTTAPLTPVLSPRLVWNSANGARREGGLRCVAGWSGGHGREFGGVALGVVSTPRVAGCARGGALFIFMSQVRHKNERPCPVVVIRSAAWQAEDFGEGRHSQLRWSQSSWRVPGARTRVV
jgi:hypothetical protein